MKFFYVFIFSFFITIFPATNEAKEADFPDNVVFALTIPQGKQMCQTINLSSHFVQFLSDEKRLDLLHKILLKHQPNLLVDWDNFKKETGFDSASELLNFISGELKVLVFAEPPKKTEDDWKIAALVSMIPSPELAIKMRSSFEIQGLKKTPQGYLIVDERSQLTWREDQCIFVLTSPPDEVGRVSSEDLSSYLTSFLEKSANNKPTDNEKTVYNLYFDIRLVKEFFKMLSLPYQSLINRLGIDSFNELMMTAMLDGNRIRTHSVVKVDNPKRGIVKIMEESEKPLGSPEKWVPADVERYSKGFFNLNAFYQLLKEEVKTTLGPFIEMQFFSFESALKETLDIDFLKLLSSIDPELIHFVSSSKKEVFVFNTSDEEVFGRFLERLPQLSGGYIKKRREHYFTNYLQGDVEVENKVSCVLYKGHVIFGESEGVDCVLANMEKNSESEDRLIDSSNYKKTMLLFPLRKEKSSGFLYWDMDSILLSVYKAFLNHEKVKTFFAPDLGLLLPKDGKFRNPSWISVSQSFFTEEGIVSEGITWLDSNKQEAIAKSTSP